MSTRFLVVSKGNNALTVKADPRSESGSESGTGPDLSPSGGEPSRLAIGKSFLVSVQTPKCGVNSLRALCTYVLCKHDEITKRK